MRLFTPLALLALVSLSTSFAPSPSLLHTQNRNLHHGRLASQQSDTAANDVLDAIVAPKISVRPPSADERGKGGVHAKESIAALEVIARIPRDLILTGCDNDDSSSRGSRRALEALANAKEWTWAADLTAAALVSLFPDPDDNVPNDKESTLKQTWIKSWEQGGWATDANDLGPEGVPWGSDCVVGSLLATGSDNDKNIYAKFRMPCHPVILRASKGLAMLCGVDDEQICLDALLFRGFAFRGMRDALLPLVLMPSDERKGSLRERRAWDVSDVLSRVLSRATTVQLGEDENDRAFVVVPLHERLAHCKNESQDGGNTKLVVMGEECLLVAVRDIADGEAITRDYDVAPRLDGDTSEGNLRLLLQFGVPPLSEA